MSSLRPVDYGKPRRPPSRGVRVTILLVVFLLALAVIGWVVHRVMAKPDLPVVSLSAPIVTGAPLDAELLYDRHLKPIANEALARNEAAVDRALATLHQRLEQHRQGIKPFAEDIVSWKTRFGVIGRQTSDLWNHHVHGDPQADSVGAYVQGKFADQVLSPQSLQDDLQTTLTTFRDDLEASHNRLLTEIELPLKDRNLPVAIDQARWNQFTADITAQSQALIKVQATDSVVDGVAQLAASNVAATVAQQLIVEILDYVGTQMATSATEVALAAGGTAAAGGAGAGGTVGTALGGPVGTAAGIGIGLAAGIAVDWWMSNRLEAKLDTQCNAYIDSLEKTLVEGTPKTEKAAAQPGLREQMLKAIHLADDAQRRAIIDHLTQVKQ